MTEILIPEPLKYRRESGVNVGQVLKFIKDEDDSFLEVFMFKPVNKEIIPVRKFQTFNPGVIKGTGNR